MARREVTMNEIVEVVYQWQPKERALSVFPDPGT